jgi:4'-phosphopantetheinyl transferase EntD
VPVTGLSLAATLGRLAPPGVLIDHRLISAGDEDALLPAEAVSFERSVLAVRRQSASARIVARELLGKVGVQDFALVRSGMGGLVWPPGLLGSIAHDDEVAIAVIAKSCEFTALGVDVEPARDLPVELIPLVTTPNERQRYPEGLCSSRVFFVVKEAVFKAVYPTDGVFLDFQDVEVDIDSRFARVRNGRVIAIALTTYPRVVAIAFARCHGAPTIQP